jgi:uncharacterized membrane protein
MTDWLHGKAESMRASLWVWPVSTAFVAFLLTLALLTVRPGPDETWGLVLWPAGSEAASTVLQVVATSIMTATTLTFSITIVALQLASQQFSPRLLREFARDPKIQSILALLISTFVVSLTGLRGIDPSKPTPVLVPALVMILGLVSAGGLVGFVGHMVRSLRVDSMMVAVHQQTLATIRQTYPDANDHSKDPDPGLPGPSGGTLVRSSRSGFVKVVRPDILVRIAREHRVFLHLGIRPGDQIVVGAPLAGLWPDESAAHVDPKAIEAELTRGIEVGFERTAEQDAALGFRQLTDIAVKAISPSINDPVTAAHAVSFCADLLIALQRRKLGPQQHLDDDGVARVVTSDRDHRYYLDLVGGPLRRYGKSDPIVLIALLRMLRDCAASSATVEQRAEIQRQVDLILENMDPQLVPSDMDDARSMAKKVGLAIRGDLEAAYDDRAGETRSA